MSSHLKCNSCGSTEIDVDPSRADAVCTNCGNVLESSIIVSDIQFEENAHGGSSAIGTFVSSDSKGGGSFSSYGGAGGGVGGGRGLGHFQAGLGRESREITLRNARKRIEALAQQLSLRRDRIDMAFYFFKLALSKHLTRGRKSSHVIAACVYITCRTESTPHMLIDFSDILQIDVYELGRTYLRLSQALCINIPAMDPCLYVMRFAHKLELEPKTHDVSMTALRLVSRMKKDWIHFGRRPSGLCGAALLIAARMHGYNRSVYDVIKVVKVHESTLRKRLNEFGETPASQLTLDEFMNIDLDAMTEEQDPPSFKAARKRDKDRLTKLEQEQDLDKEIGDLEQKIESALEEMRTKLHKRSKDPGSSRMIHDPQNIDQGQQVVIGENPEENRMASEFITDKTLESISELVQDKNKNLDSLLMPPPHSNSSPGLVPGLGLKDTIQEYLEKDSSSTSDKNEAFEEEEGVDDENDELDLTGIDDEEIQGYIMSEQEIAYKTKMWMKVNAEYLKEKALKEEKEKKEAEEAEREGREPKKKLFKKSLNQNQNNKKKSSYGAPGSNQQHQTAIEAIEKIVAEKKISTKINYDVLKSLNSPIPNAAPKDHHLDENSEGIFGVTSPKTIQAKSPQPKRLASLMKREDRDLSLTKSPPPALLGKRKRQSMPASPRKNDVNVVVESGPVVAAAAEEPVEEDEEEDDEPDLACLSAQELLKQHRGDDEYGGTPDDYYEEEYY